MKCSTKHFQKKNIFFYFYWSRRVEDKDTSGTIRMQLKHDDDDDGWLTRGELAQKPRSWYERTVTVPCSPPPTHALRKYKSDRLPVDYRLRISRPQSTANASGERCAFVVTESLPYHITNVRVRVTYILSTKKKKNAFEYYIFFGPCSARVVKRSISYTYKFMVKTKIVFAICS